MTKLVSSLEKSSQTGSKEIYKIQQCKIPFENNISKNEKKKKTRRYMLKHKKLRVTNTKTPLKEY